ncbi:hypothetical protein, partial [Bacillus cereus group sp. N14]|uniref:hypothetical protein n=1 Tax=Bacillus cereus group sp. N14 TaxID=2794587 RepID=UPI0023DEEBB8
PPETDPLTFFGLVTGGPERHSITFNPVGPVGPVGPVIPVTPVGPVGPVGNVNPGTPVGAGGSMGAGIAATGVCVCAPIRKVH